MVDGRQVVAVAGVGDLGRYVCEELLASPDFHVIVLTRQVSISTVTSSVASHISTDHMRRQASCSSLRLEYQSRLAEKQRCSSLSNGLYRLFAPLHPEQHFRNNADLIHQYCRLRIYSSSLGHLDCLPTVIHLQAPDSL